MCIYELHSDRMRAQIFFKKYIYKLQYILYSRSWGASCICSFFSSIFVCSHSLSCPVLPWNRLPRILLICPGQSKPHWDCYPVIHMITGVHWYKNTSFPHTMQPHKHSYSYSWPLISSLNFFSNVPTTQLAVSQASGASCSHELIQLKPNLQLIEFVTWLLLYPYYTYT